MRLFNRIALVTGAGRGIGKAIALGYAREGADLALVARTSEEVLETARQIELLGRKALPIVTDVSHVARVQEIVEQCIMTFGRVDILVNNAGTTVIKPSESITEHDWDQVINTNLKATFFLCQAAGRYMLRAGSGVIINIGSIASFVGLPGRAVYCTSKGGVALLTRSLASEWASKGIRVNCLAPGYIRTEGHDVLVEQGFIKREKLAEATPAKRVASVDEIAGPAIFLASDEAAFMHGETIVVDGGWIADGHLPAML